MALSEQDMIRLINQMDLGSRGAEGRERGDPSPQLGKSAAAIANGEIRIIPDERNSPVILEIVDPVELLVGGIPRKGRVVVHPEDAIEWSVAPEPLFKIEIADDRMTAWFRLYAKRRFAWKLRNREPSGELVVEAVEDFERIVQELELSDVQTVLHEKKLLTYNRKAIEAELLQPTHKRIVIAEGRPPVQSRDAQIELLFNEKVESSFEEVNGSIDFRNHLKIPSAQKGEIVARKIPMIAGEAGYDIFGSVIEPKPAKDLILVAKDHTQIVDGTNVVALKEGRPRITGGGRIKLVSINPFYVVSGNVDLKTGNIFFSGDVYVYGDVTDGMVVEALGNVHVFGSVYNATVTATGSIFIKGNVIGGKLYSGHFGVLYNRLYNFTKKLNEQLLSMRNAWKMLTDTLTSRGASVPSGQSLQLLADTKFKDIPVCAKEILGCIATIQNIQSGHLETLKQRLLALLRPSCFLQVEPIAFLNELQQMLGETSETIKRSEETVVQMDIPKCQLSTVMSNGDILIRKEGVLQSQLYSKNNIVFYQNEAVCKGSQLEAGHMISAMIVGGLSGGASTLKAGVSIYVRKMYDGRIFVQRFSQEILEAVENMKFFVRDQRLAAQREG